ncbi:MAG: hypothetical protein R6X02_28275 [Enhygromyxa sp.]
MGSPRWQISRDWLPWFELWAIVSIANYLIKLGEGLSENMAGVIGRGRAIARQLGIRGC